MICPEFRADLFSVNTQLLAMIPYAFAICATLITCYLSDRYNKRFVPAFVCLACCIIGLILLSTTSNKIALISGCCFVAAGSTACVPVTAAWVLSIHAGYTKKSTVFTLNMVMIEMYAIMATHIYDTPPRFLKGHGIVLGVTVLSLACAVALYFHLLRENKKRD